MAPFTQYEGQIVSQSYHVGFVVLSCLVSFIGAASTLELINRRTGSKGLYNNLLLVSSAITMGGVTIWSMHFVGNRAMQLAGGEGEMQISYSVGFTVLSFFVPIAVLLAAFVAVGSNSVVSLWRISASGIICGGAVCGMHYLGNASIMNYSCVYNAANVAGAAVISVAASTVALSMFFVFRATWANSWWKQLLSAVVLAGAVSGMHWCAALGTTYRFESAESAIRQPSRDATVIVVICLSIGACFIIAGSAILKARHMSRSARKARKVTLAAAIFDKHGRILVDNNGVMPSTVVTDSFRDAKAELSTSHPLFHWMFHATRNWPAIANLIPGIRSHLDHTNTDKSQKSRLDRFAPHPRADEGYDLVFRELFCVAANALADRLREPLTSVGTLWDEILPTGVSRFQLHHGQSNLPETPIPMSPHGMSFEDALRAADAVERGSLHSRPHAGTGSLLVLVRRVETDRDAERFVSAGYRFAETHQVNGLIRSRMQILSMDFDAKLKAMASYSKSQTHALPRVAVAFFGIRARVDCSGFDLVVRKGERSTLPYASLPIDALGAWELHQVKQLENRSTLQILQALDDAQKSDVSTKEKAFAASLSSAIRELRNSIHDDLFDRAVLSGVAADVPSHDQAGAETQSKLLVFRLLIPIHNIIASPTCEIVPISLFKVRQLGVKQQMDFMQRSYQELAAVAQGSSPNTGAIDTSASRFWQRARMRRLSSSQTVNKIPQSSKESFRSGSTVDLCPVDRRPSSSSGMHARSQSFGGILVSQEIKVDNDADTRRPEIMIRRMSTLRDDGHENMELKSVGQVVTNIETGPTHVIGGRDTDLGRTMTFADVLFAQCVEAAQD